MIKSEWREVSDGKWESTKIPGVYVINNFNYLEVGHKYVIQDSFGYPGQEWINPLEEVIVEQFSPDKKLVKLNGIWKESKIFWSVKVHAELPSGIRG